MRLDKSEMNSLIYIQFHSLKMLNGLIELYTESVLQI